MTPFDRLVTNLLDEPAVFTDFTSHFTTLAVVGCSPVERALLFSVNCARNMGILASRGIEYEDSYRSFTERERQQLLSLFDRLATANEHGIMKVEIEPFKVRIF